MASDSPSESAPKFRRRAQARPDEVLDAAQALFGSQGYGATSVETIARRAGISKGAVYLYFPSKLAILEGLVARAIGSVPEELADMVADAQGSVRGLITVLLTGLARRLTAPGALDVPRIVIHEALTAPELARMYRRQVIDRAMPALAALIARGVAQGEFRPCDPELTVRSVMGPVLTHILLDEIFSIRPEGGLRIEALVENHLSLLFDGLAMPGKVSNG